MYHFRFIEELKEIIKTEVHIYKLKGNKMESVCFNWHILKANKRLNDRYDFRKLNKITRNIEHFMYNHCDGECKKLLKIIENKRDPTYILDYPK